MLGWFRAEGSRGKPDTCYEIDDFLANGVHSATPRNFADFVEGGTKIKFPAGRTGVRRGD